MKAFDHDRYLVTQYERFARSFTTIRADDLQSEISRQYEQGRFWPDALLSLNPHYERGPTIDDLSASGDLCAETAQIFRFGPDPIKFHRHQAQAIAKAQASHSFVVTTGTGSGKSLCFFVPIVDAVIRARKAGQPRRTRTIIVYPMNALANSQINEIKKFIDQSGLPENLRPIVRRYTGQESQDMRLRVVNEVPDILLTNFMMAELLLTRQDSVDRQVIANAKGLEFIVLDEFHTYRGRQGADVAVLVRRLRDRCASDTTPVCIGTSATMANEGSDQERSKSVSEAASRLFGIKIGPDAIIDESLRRATDDRLALADVEPKLAEAVTTGLTARLTDDDLSSHPLAVWAELALGLSDGQVLRRRQPIPFGEAARLLAQASELDVETCHEALESFLTHASLPESARGGGRGQAFLAFKLHRFIAGAGDVFSTLRPKPRSVLLEGQLEDPSEPGTRLYPIRFCRECGQEHYIVTKAHRSPGIVFLPRSIDDTPFDADGDADVAGYLAPVGSDDPDYRFDGSIETFPEGWIEERRGVARLRSNRTNRVPEKFCVAGDGRIAADGVPFWFIPGKFGFCPCCLDEPQSQMRERSKLAGLTAEGRSSATTLLVSSSLQWLNQPESTVPADKRKLLGFTDNRQDAALQAGHFNDFIFVSLLRGAILRAVLDAGEDGLRDDEFGYRVQRALGFTALNMATRRHWMLNPTAGAGISNDAERSLAKVLAHRVWTDLRRGWRFTNPNLSKLRLIEVDFIGLDDVAGDAERLGKALPALGDLDHDARQRAIRTLLHAVLEGLAVDTESLDPALLDTVSQRARKFLRQPWSIDDKEAVQGRADLCLTALGKRSTGLRDERLLLRGGPRSRLARQINSESIIGTRLAAADYIRFMLNLLSLLADEGILTRTSSVAGHDTWRLSPSAVRLVPGKAVQTGSASGNPYFHDLYCRLADELANGNGSLFGMESREHTAQVAQMQREWREWRFRYEAEDRERIAENEHVPEIGQSGESSQFLPAMFCTPTMELGVDISALNAVFLRNVPPTPANYAQRAGRAGRSGQAASILTYCAAQSPHDQYYFERRIEMVAGSVRPPTLDIGNKSLVISHLQAIWLAETGLALSPEIPKILNLCESGYPLEDSIRETVFDPSLKGTAFAPMRRVLDGILASLNDTKPGWLGDPDDFVAETVNQAPHEFNSAFDRWRELYESAQGQLREANRQSQIPGLPRAERRKIKAAQVQANNQIEILEQGRTANSSDFYSYRYLATEGFLPGYNFPRLPLYAYIPGDRQFGTYLQRARFMAISEFGPRSLIYHEGRAYRVTKAKLPPETRTEDGRELATRDIAICPSCGAAHDEEVERCHACNTSMSGASPVKRTLRIDNVEAAPVERITANDEERIHQGFDIQTVFSWPRKQGVPEITEVQCRTADAPLLTLQYANSAEISRINKGLRRRQEQTVLGFMIDPRTGYWAKSVEEGEETDVSPDADRPVRIVPIVRDRKNALLLRFEEPERYEPGTITTVQHALLRGIAVEYQLEEGEILGEPLPDRNNRRAILAYEATEGGAGVLSRLVEDSSALSQVTRQALELMHYDRPSIEEAVTSADPSRLREREHGACVRGCYRCLLSYFNQPDHEAIDRASSEALQLLIDLARSRLEQPGEANHTGLVDGWTGAFAQNDMPSPDGKPLTLAEVTFPFVWRSHYVAAKPGSIPAGARSEGSDKGWSLFDLPSDPSGDPPVQLIKTLTG